MNHHLLPSLLLSALLAFGPSCAQAQSISDLQSHYNGTTTWNADTGAFSFTSSGVIDFKRDKEMSGIWTVPTEVKTITIKAKVKVTGQFTVSSDCTIAGEDENTSIIYGTDTPALLHNQGLDHGGRCVPYSAVYAQGKISVDVKNLTTMNPVGFMWTGHGDAQIHLDHVRGIDNRGGSSSHSDGIQAGDGSSVRNCYLETGDDCIKVYHNIVVENTTIKMITNCVPIQLGWGSYGNSPVGVFRNVTIIGNLGRGQFPSVIVGQKGTYKRTVEMDGVTIKNPNASLVSLKEAGMDLTLTIKNGDIAVKQFWNVKVGTCHSDIDGSKEQVSTYHRS